jgi:Thioesterase-like superfamily
LTFPDRITVLHKLRKLSSDTPDTFKLDVVILSEKTRRVAARCEEEIVVYDYRVAKKAPMDDWVASAFEIIIEEQEGWQEKCKEKLRDVDGQLRELEVQIGYRKAD